MLLQTLVVAAIVLSAVLYLGRGVVRTLRSARASRKGACGSSCGCADH